MQEAEDDSHEAFRSGLVIMFKNNTFEPGAITATMERILESKKVAALEPLVRRSRTAANSFSSAAHVTSGTCKSTGATSSIERWCVSTQRINRHTTRWRAQGPKRRGHCQVQRASEMTLSG